VTTEGAQTPFGTESRHQPRLDAPNAPRTSTTRGGRPKAPPGELPVADDGWSTCPICKRTWLVIGADDVWLPGCGAYGTDWHDGNRHRPCVPCGLAHERSCPVCGLVPNEDEEGEAS